MIKDQDHSQDFNTRVRNNCI